MMVATLISPFFTTARSSPAPTARIVACGGLMTAEKSLMPNMPRLETAVVPPWYSSGFSFLVPGPRGHVLHLVGDHRQRLVVGMADDRRDQPAGDRDGDADIGMFVLHHRGFGPRDVG